MRPGQHRLPGAGGGLRFAAGREDHCEGGVPVDLAAQVAQVSGALEQAAAQFPGHRITREHTGAGLAYAAQARDLATHPYTVMASSLEQLCARLGAANPPAT